MPPRVQHATDIAMAAQARSASTSPVREPPPEEFMREGLENDEVYIMVEDEFLATAQAFTRHLHYAEYARRKKAAKLANQSAPPPRPTDGRSKLSDETRKKLEAEKASARQKAALEDLKTAAGRPPVDSEVEDVDETTQITGWIARHQVLHKGRVGVFYGFWERTKE
ncbi:predicted protein [Uncinocarpus reesii 1704]|uniref:Uncharacterized protein n=1 Tax=Uncinocarpus reesii (strain UAMH 1704) TaxID=336963 RepID=C4JDP3_UNCRE|nr:uncharacterized protein UREG_00357 [Uncinocarpus reesii 1704]EEP75511.1 predicted protein [Uncinocarpus reesii 1704]